MGNFVSWLKTNLPSLGKDERIGDARQQSQPPSVSGMVSTLIPVLVISSICLILFLILRVSQRRFYAPRTYPSLVGENEKSPELPRGFINWIFAFWKIPDIYILQRQGLDAYLFLRFLQVCTVMLFICLIITWAVLFPIHATGSNQKSQLEIISYSNINIDTDSNRLYAHAFVGWVIYGFIMYLITRESIFYIALRQAFLLAPEQAQRISSRTVLFTAVPDKLLHGENLHDVFENKGIKKVWVVGETKKLDKLVQDRDEIAMKLEKCLTKFLKTINKYRLEAIKDSDRRYPSASLNAGVKLNATVLAILRKMRPSHRLGAMGLMGKEVDTIEWTRSRLRTLIYETEAAQATYLSGDFKKTESVFIEFVSQSEAQDAFQLVTHHHALHMSARYIGIKPEEIIWSNLNITWWQRIIRCYLVYLLVFILITFWAVPVGIVGIITQVDKLKEFPSLIWISDIPDTILSIISGLFPSIVLAILMSSVPILMRILAMLAGEVSLAHIELFTQSAYFYFQLLQVFLIRTLTDTVSVVLIQTIESPSAIFQILSQAIPTSSNFYISYFIMQGFTIAPNILTQLISCLTFNLLYKFYDNNTPRALYTRWISLSTLSWGNILPTYTTITVISITYAVIAPLMLFWATIALGLFYLAYRYNILFVTDTQVDTHGLFYPRALQHLFFGIYIAEISMVGMFAVSKAPGPGALIGSFFIFTILYHITLKRSLGPLFLSLPRTLQANEQQIYRSDSSGLDGARGNILTRFLKPWVYSNYEILRYLVRPKSTIGPYVYNDETLKNAYLPPSVTSTAPVLWIPRDRAGMSKIEVALTKTVICISDEGCELDENNKLQWNTEGVRPPIWREKIHY